MTDKNKSSDIAKDGDAPDSQKTTTPDLSQEKTILANIEKDPDTGQLFLKWDDMLIGLPEGFLIVEKSKLIDVIEQNKAFRKFKVEFEEDLQYLVQTVVGFLGTDGVNNPLKLVAKIGKAVTNPKSMEKDGIDFEKLQTIISKYVPEVTNSDND